MLDKFLLHSKEVSLSSLLSKISTIHDPIHDPTTFSNPILDLISRRLFFDVASLKH